MSYERHMKGYLDLRTLYQADSLYVWRHDKYFPPMPGEISPAHRCNQQKRGGEAQILRDAVLLQGARRPLMHKAGDRFAFQARMKAKYACPSSINNLFPFLKLNPSGA